MAKIELNRLVRALGPRDAIFVYRLFLFEDKSKPFKGEKWSTWSREKLCEYTGLTLKQLKESLTTLESKGIIERERHLKGGVIRPFIRFSPKAEAVITLLEDAGGKSAKLLIGPEKAQSDWSQMGPTMIGPKWPFPIGPKWDQSSNKKRIYKKKTYEVAGITPAAPGGESPEEGLQEKTPSSQELQEDAPANVQELAQEDSMNADDIAKAFENAQAKPPSKPVKVGRDALALFWKRSCVAHGHTAPLNFTGQELGQLGHVIKTLPAKDVYTTVEKCIAGWVGFGAYVGKMAGAYSIPQSPHIGFFLKYIEHAREFAIKRTLEEAAKAKGPQKSGKITYPKLFKGTIQEVKG